MVYKYPNIFELHEPNNVILASALYPLCETTISLDILHIRKQQPDISPEDIVSRLSLQNRLRIQNESDLLHFLQRHKDFHQYELRKYFPNGKIMPTEESIVDETDVNTSDENVPPDGTSTASAIIQEDENSIHSRLTPLEVNVLQIGK